MSFSTEMKNELVRLEIQDHQVASAQLAGIVRMDGTILIGSGKKVSLELISENAAVARWAYGWLQKLFKVHAEIKIERRTQLKKNIRYIVYIPPQPRMRSMLHALGMMDESGLLFRSDIPEEFLSRDELRRAYLRGVFLGGGSMTDPQKSYHLEIVTMSEEHAAALTSLIENYGITPKKSYRKENVLVYLKESEQISDFLALIGAHQAVIDFENIRVNKEIRNRVNRVVNCETANLSKSLNAGLRQAEMILALQEVMSLDNLPKALQEAAYKRLEAPDVSMRELGEMMDPPIGKSGINHRMRRIEAIARDTIPTFFDE